MVEDVEISDGECNPHKNSWEESNKNALKMITSIGTILNNIQLKHNLLTELTAYKNPRIILSTYKRHTFVRSYNKRKSCFTLKKDDSYNGSSYSRQYVCTDLDGSGEAGWFY